jgi:pimeloyl-ACP methyl ester carboxylesterase
MMHVTADQEGPIGGHWRRERARDRRFVRYDQRGYSMSDREAPSYLLDAAVQDLNAVVDELAVEQGLAKQSDMEGWPQE